MGWWLRVEQVPLLRAIDGLSARKDRSTVGTSAGTGSEL